MKRWIPNLITLFNLACGCAAVICILDLRLYLAFWFVFAAGLADFMDGLAARLLQVSSPVGKELDSLADMVSFGFVPGAALYTMLALGPEPNPLSAQEIGLVWHAMPGFLVTLLSAVRLARFNLDTRQTDHFIGLATPSSTLFVMGLMLVYFFDSFGLRSVVGQPWLLYGSAVLLAWLLVAEIPMFSFKFKSTGWRDNRLQYGFAITAIVLLLLLREAALSLIVVIYVLLNLIRNRRVTA